MKPVRIITGGQTGADLGALRAGLTLGYIPGHSLGGWMPRNFRTERGMRPWMAKMYGMKEHAATGYQPRTRDNVHDAEHVILFGEISSPGSRLTVDLCRDWLKPYWVNPTVETLQKVDWGRTMVAGNRETGNRGIEAYVHWLLLTAWLDPLPACPLIEPPKPGYWSPTDQWSPLKGLHG